MHNLPRNWMAFSTGTTPSHFAILLRLLLAFFSDQVCVALGHGGEAYLQVIGIPNLHYSVKRINFVTFQLIS